MERYKDMAQINAENAYHAMNRGRMDSGGRLGEQNNHSVDTMAHSYGLAVNMKSTGNAKTRQSHGSLSRPTDPVSCNLQPLSIIIIFKMYFNPI